ncbi:Acetyltransferase (GNAT) family protein [Vibrio mangrovi]|nr:Acetyltransferase (GNAT) family protein [Vibrio mangrovi]
MSIKYRKAAGKDAQAISELIVPLTRKYVCPTFDESMHDTLLQSMSVENIERYLSEGYLYVVATDDMGEIVGVAAIRDASHLYHLFVSERYQGQGLSRKLWEKVRAEVPENRRPTRFTVNSALNAEHVYRSFGFVRTEEGVRNRNGIIDVPMVLNVDC